MNETRTMATPRPVAAFVRRVEELQNAAELSDALAVRLERVEQRLLGHRPDDQNDGASTKIVGGSLNGDLELYADHIRESLERLAASIERLDIESDGIPMEQDPVDDCPPMTGTGPQ